jgi:hypothetical protein
MGNGLGWFTGFTEKGGNRFQSALVQGAIAL